MLQNAVSPQVSRFCDEVRNFSYSKGVEMAVRPHRLALRVFTRYHRNEKLRQGYEDTDRILLLRRREEYDGPAISNVPSSVFFNLLTNVMSFTTTGTFSVLSDNMEYIDHCQASLGFL